MLLQRLKAFGLVFLLGAILSGGVGTYVYFKLKGETSAQISELKSQMENYEDTVDVLGESFVRREELRSLIRTERAEVGREVRDVKQTSESARDYLDSVIPNELQLVLKRARCLQVPGKCVHGDEKTPGT